MRPIAVAAVLSIMFVSSAAIAQTPKSGVAKKSAKKRTKPDPLAKQKLALAKLRDAYNMPPKFNQAQARKRIADEVAELERLANQ